MYKPAGDPKSKLGYYRQLAPVASVRISPLILGAMSLGTEWSEVMGSTSKEESFAILDEFYNNGGNAIDTSISYRKGQSEEWIGEWMKERGTRNSMVIMTKFTSLWHQEGVFVNHAGNSTKSLRIAIDESLKRLQTDYVDVLYVHWLDYTTSVEELCQSLNQLIAIGKVLYLAVSDTPAWYVSKFNQYAKCNGLRGFSIYQGRWSVAERDFEREIIPMCREEGMAIAPWGALGGGHFKTQAQIDEMARNKESGRNMPVPTENHKKLIPVLETIANEIGTSITSVAMAYVMAKAPYVFPIIGCRKLQHLKDNIKALDVKLTADQISKLESAYSFELGFPHNFLGGTTYINHVQLAKAGKYEWVDIPRSISIK